MINCKFIFTRDNSDHIMKNIKGMISLYDFKWIDKHDVLQSETIDELFGSINFQLEYDDCNECYYIDYFTSEKYEDYNKIFESIAELIEEGSYLEFMNADGDIWKYSFKHGKLIEDYAEIVYPKDIEKIFLLSMSGYGSESWSKFETKELLLDSVRKMCGEGVTCEAFEAIQINNIEEF